MDKYRELFWGPLGNFSKLLLAVLAIWSIFWTGLALWKAARNGQKNWFVAMLILNTAGILEIIYISFFQKKVKTSKKKK